MNKEIKTVDEKKGIIRITTSDERFYAIPSPDKITGLPSEYDFIPSVTWICSYFPKGVSFWKWLASKGWDEAEHIKQEAGEKGSKVHRAIERLIKGETIPMDLKLTDTNNENEEELSVEEYECLMAFTDWFNKVNPEIIAVEIITVNKEEKYAGTVDIVCRIDDQLYIIDIKTGQYIWPSYELQLSAYKHAINPEEYKIKDYENVKLAVLQVGYNRNKNRYKFTEINDKFDLFLATKQIWKNECENISPMQKDYPIELKLNIKKEEKNIINKKKGK